MSQDKLSTEEFETLVRMLFNRVRGRLAGFTEAVGLPEKQERAMISMMKQLTYEAENEIVDASKDIVT